MKKICKIEGCNRKIRTGRKYCYEHRHTAQANRTKPQKEIDYDKPYLWGVIIIFFSSFCLYFKYNKSIIVVILSIIAFLLLGILYLRSEKIKNEERIPLGKYNK